MNMLKMFERPRVMECEQPRPKEIVPHKTTTRREAQTDAMPKLPEELKLDDNRARIELPEVEVPENRENWYDAYADIVEYQSSDEPIDTIAAVGCLEQRYPGFSKSWLKKASSEAVHRTLDQAIAAAHELGDDCRVMMRNNQRGVSDAVRVRRELARHKLIKNFVENTDVDSEYIHAYDYLCNSTSLIGLTV